MVSQLDEVALFVSMSATDIKWPILIRCIWKLIDKKEYTDEYVEKEMT